MDRTRTKGSNVDSSSPPTRTDGQIRINQGHKRKSLSEISNFKNKYRKRNSSLKLQECIHRVGSLTNEIISSCINFEKLKEGGYKYLQKNEDTLVYANKYQRNQCHQWFLILHHYRGLIFHYGYMMMPRLCYIIMENTIIDFSHSETTTHGTSLIVTKMVNRSGKYTYRTFHPCFRTSSTKVTYSQGGHDPYCTSRDIHRKKCVHSQYIKMSLERSK